MYDMNTGNETWEWVNLKEVITISVFLVGFCIIKLGVTMECCLILFVYDLDGSWILIVLSI